MAPKASKILQRTRATVFDIEGEEWQVEFRPFSRDMMRRATQGSDAEQFDGICNLLADSVVAWNLEDDEGRPLAIAPDRQDGDGTTVTSPGMTWLRAAGLDYVKLIFDGLVEAIRVPKPSDAPSNSSFSRVA